MESKQIIQDTHSSVSVEGTEGKLSYIADLDLYQHDYY